MEKVSLSTPLGRITVIDALRGFALLGVVLVHMTQHYGIFSFSNREMSEPLSPAFDEFVRWLTANVLSGRFINIFSFLFGLSFFIQIDRAKRKGIDFHKRFVWRMIILFVIGIVGNCFYTADILPIYAILGIVLVFLSRFKNQVLVVITALLLLGTPRLLMVGYDRLNQTELVQNGIQRTSEERPSVRPSMQMEKPSFINSAKNNLTNGLEMKMNIQFGKYGRGYLTMALFILGLIAGRFRFFETVHERKKRNVLLFIGFTLGTLLIDGLIKLFPAHNVGYFTFMMPNVEVTPSLLMVAMLGDISTVLFSGALVMGFIICYHLNGIGKYLNVLSPYGRMGLTNYELQNITGCLVFSPWAFGTVFGNWGATEVFLLGLSIYILQIVISRYWLRSFLYGPLEWLWRSATYLQRQPLKKSSKTH